jgi:hypothetical protein
VALPRSPQELIYARTRTNTREAPPYQERFPAAAWYVRLQVHDPLEYARIPSQCVRGIEQVRAPKDRLSDLSVEHHGREDALTNETGEAATQICARRLASAPCKAAVTVLISYRAITLLGLDLREFRKRKRLSLEI